MVSSGLRENFAKKATVMEMIEPEVKRLLAESFPGKEIKEMDIYEIKCIVNAGISAYKKKEKLAARIEGLDFTKARSITREEDQATIEILLVYYTVEMPDGETFVFEWASFVPLAGQPGNLERRRSISLIKHNGKDCLVDFKDEEALWKRLETAAKSFVTKDA